MNAGVPRPRTPAALNDLLREFTTAPEDIEFLAKHSYVSVSQIHQSIHLTTLLIKIANHSAFVHQISDAADCSARHDESSGQQC